SSTLLTLSGSDLRDDKERVMEEPVSDVEFLRLQNDKISFALVHSLHAHMSYVKPSF
ncbi:unnamed protein product, partial [Allacma fusca]